MLSVCHIFQTVGYYGFGTLVPTVLASKGYSIVTSLTFTSLAFIGYPVGSALSLPIIERLDRRWLIVGSAFLMSGFGLGLGFASSSAMIVAMGFLYTVASNVFSNALHVFQVEIFPTFVRATASGTAYGMSRLSSGAMPFVLLPLLDRWGAGAMFAAIAAALWIVMADIALFASTTGRSLETASADTGRRPAAPGGCLVYGLTLAGVRRSASVTAIGRRYPACGCSEEHDTGATAP